MTTLSNEGNVLSSAKDRKFGKFVKVSISRVLAFGRRTVPNALRFLFDRDPNLRTDIWGISLRIWTGQSGALVGNMMERL